MWRDRPLDVTADYVVAIEARSVHCVSPGWFHLRKAEGAVHRMVVEMARQASHQQVAGVAKAAQFGARGRRSALGGRGVVAPPVAPPEASIEDAKLPTEIQPALLPGELQPATYLKAALARLTFLSGDDEHHFIRGWFTEPCAQLLVTFAWHTVCAHFRTEVPGLADRLFSTLALAHARLFTFETVIHSTRIKDALAWYLPEALSHAIIPALKKAYPRDVEIFDEQLQRRLFAECVTWTSGFGDPFSRRGGRTSPRGPALDQTDDEAKKKKVDAPPLPSEIAEKHLEKTKERQRRERARSASITSVSSIASDTPVKPPPGAPLVQFLDFAEGKGQPAELEREGAVRDLLRVAKKSPRPVIKSRSSAAELARQVTEKATAAAAARLRAQSAGRALPLGEVPAVTREYRNMSACSPLTARWLQLKQLQGDGRGGWTPREGMSHRVLCSRPIPPLDVPKPPDPKKSPMPKPLTPRSPMSPRVARAASPRTSSFFVTQSEGALGGKAEVL